MYQPSDFGRTISSSLRNGRLSSSHSVTLELPTAVEIEKIIVILALMLPVGFTDAIAANASTVTMVDNDFIPRTAAGPNAFDKIVDALAAVVLAFRTNPTPVVTADDIVRVLRNFQRAYVGQ